MVKIASAIDQNEKNNLRPIIILSNQLVKKLSSEVDIGIEFINVKNFPGPTPDPEKQSRKIFKDFKFYLNTVLSTPVLEKIHYLYKTFKIKRELKQAKKILKEINAKTIVIPGDRNGGLEPILIRAAREIGCVSVIPPAALSASIDSLLIPRRGKMGHRVTRNKKFKLQYPNQWIHDYISGEDISYFGVTATYAYSMNQMLPSNPWVIGGGWSDFVLVESSDVKRRYIELGVNQNKIIITGNVDHDKLYQNINRKNEIRTQIISKYDLDKSKKILIIFLPNWFEGGLREQKWHWKENEFLCESVINLDCNILLTLHPSQKIKQYEYLIRRYPKIRLLSEPLINVLPIADIYFTGKSSSTVPWAILSLVPTIIANHYQEKNEIYLNMPGVVYVNFANKIQNEINKMIIDKNYFEYLKSCQKSMGIHFGILDGEATSRIIEAIRNPKTNSNKNEIIEKIELG